jgi:hypothetical protein
MVSTKMILTGMSEPGTGSVKEKGGGLLREGSAGPAGALLLSFAFAVPSAIVSSRQAGAS